MPVAFCNIIYQCNQKSQSIKYKLGARSGVVCKDIHFFLVCLIHCVFNVMTKHSGTLCKLLETDSERNGLLSSLLRFIIKALYL